jgi:hypothetical protein
MDSKVDRYLGSLLGSSNSTTVAFYCRWSYFRKGYLYLAKIFDYAEDIEF